MKALTTLVGQPDNDCACGVAPSLEASSWKLYWWWSSTLLGEFPFLRLPSLCFACIIRVALVISRQMICHPSLCWRILYRRFCYGRCFAAIALLHFLKIVPGGCFTALIGCWVDALPSLLCCRPCTLNVVVCFSRLSDVVVARFVGSGESPPLMFLLFFFDVGVACHLLGGTLLPP